MPVAAVASNAGAISPAGVPAPGRSGEALEFGFDVDGTFGGGDGARTTPGPAAFVLPRRAAAVVDGRTVALVLAGGTEAPLNQTFAGVVSGLDAAEVASDAAGFGGASCAADVEVARAGVTTVPIFAEPNPAGTFAAGAVISGTEDNELILGGFPTEPTNGFVAAVVTLGCPADRSENAAGATAVGGPLGRTGELAVAAGIRVGCLTACGTDAGVVAAGRLD